MQINILRFTVACMLLAVIASASEANSEIHSSFVADFVAPETELVEGAFLNAQDSISDEAKSTVAQLLQSGKSPSACKDLAEATIKDVEDSVKTAQKILETTDDGSKCKDEGQNLVTAATTTANTASKSADDTKRAADAACSANVQLKPQPFSSLKAGQCSFVTNDPAFVQAKKTCNDNTKSADNAKGALQGANTALASAKETAKAESKKCRCATQAAHKVATEAANKGNSAENKKAWDKAHNMLCVLAAESKCKVPPLPTATPPKIDTAAAKEKCDKKPDQYYYQIKATHGQCLDANQRNKSGGKVHMWTCNTKNQNKSQMWEYDGHNNGRIKATHGLCLDAPQRNKKGGKLTVSNCGSSNKNQMWEKKGSQIKNKHGICIDAGGKNERSKNGGKCHMWTCQSSNDNQKWQLIRKTKKA